MSDQTTDSGSSRCILNGPSVVDDLATVNVTVLFSPVKPDPTTMVPSGGSVQGQEKPDCKGESYAGLGMSSYDGTPSVFRVWCEKHGTYSIQVDDAWQSETQRASVVATIADITERA
jgi:hypothetical protein